MFVIRSCITEIGMYFTFSNIFKILNVFPYIKVSQQSTKQFKIPRYWLTAWMNEWPFQARKLSYSADVLRGINRKNSKILIMWNLTEEKQQVNFQSCQGRTQKLGVVKQDKSSWQRPTQIFKNRFFRLMGTNEGSRNLTWVDPQLSVFL